MLKFLNGFHVLSELWRRGLAAGVDPEMLPWQQRPKCHALEHLVLDKTLLCAPSPPGFLGLHRRELCRLRQGSALRVLCERQCVAQLRRVRVCVL